MFLQDHTTQQSRSKRLPTMPFPPGDAKAVGGALSLLPLGMDSQITLGWDCTVFSLQGLCDRGLSSRSHSKLRASRCPLHDGSASNYAQCFLCRTDLKQIFPTAGHSQSLRQPRKGSVLTAPVAQKCLCPNHKYFQLPFSPWGTQLGLDCANPKGSPVRSRAWCCCPTPAAPMGSSSATSPGE